jgi:hypothetical protein
MSMASSRSLPGPIAWGPAIGLAAEPELACPAFLLVVEAEWACRWWSLDHLRGLSLAPASVSAISSRGTSWP